MNIAMYTRALRLPFITATIFPFLAGSVLARHCDFIILALGLFCAVSTHIAANLINDYADSKSGADWQDKKFYGFFGGSKLIQEGKLSEVFYLKQAVMYFVAAFAAAVLLAVVTHRVQVLVYFLSILLLGIFYSLKPWAFSYRYLGEVLIFTLFGPACVMGAYYLQCGVFPARESAYLAIPFGFFTTAILFANEIADFSTDTSVSKYNLVALVTPKYSYIFYYFLMVLSYMWLTINILAGYLHYLSFLGIFVFVHVGLLLRKNYAHKDKLIVTSRYTIIACNFAAIIMVISLWL
jgi:1,4-dihydroxy-2-naphthoate octaprenyltransferase